MMKFWLLLQVLSWRLRWLAWRSEPFRKQLAGRDIVMQWSVKSGAPARWFHFTPSKVASGRGVHAAPTLTLTFEDAAYAFATIKAAGSNKAVIAAGMNAGRIKVGGRDPGQLMWFFTLLKIIAPA
jgi:hypothetical protein